MRRLKCGGGVFYKAQDIYFYTGRDYVEIGPKFKGKLSWPLMGADVTACTSGWVMRRKTLTGMRLPHSMEY